MAVRVRFAPSPTGSLHLGNALTAVANRRYADERGGVFVLRIDDTDSSRTVEGGEAAILDDLAWLGVSFDEGPVRQSERGDLYAAAAARAVSSGAAERDDEGAVRLGGGGTTLVRPDGSATYQLASVVDDLELAITHVIRGSDHRPNLELQRRIARAVGGELPEVIHHGLVLGPDGKKLSKRHGHSAIVDLREEGFPAAGRSRVPRGAGTPRARRPARPGAAPATGGRRDRCDVGRGAGYRRGRLDRGRARAARRAVSGRGEGRTRSSSREPRLVQLPAEATPTLERFLELRAAAEERLDMDGARGLTRELKAVGGDLRALRVALTGAETGPELAAVLVAVPRAEALARAEHAIGG